MTWQPIVLFGFAGLLAGGVISAWRNGAKVLSVVLGVIAAAMLTGGVLWVLGE